MSPFEFNRTREFYVLIKRCGRLLWDYPQLFTSHTFMMISSFFNIKKSYLTFTTHLYAPYLVFFIYLYAQVLCRSPSFLQFHSDRSGHTKICRTHLCTPIEVRPSPSLVQSQDTQPCPEVDLEPRGIRPISVYLGISGPPRRM